MNERDENRGGMQSGRDRERRGDANRDPITKEPGAHPVGTGVGAAAGGAAGVAGGAAAGAATGTAAGGPVGAGIGAIVGGVAGAAAGKGVAERNNPTRAGAADVPGGLENYIGYSVVDRDDEKIGTLDCLWSDHTGDPAFLGVRTGWIFGRTHVVPAHGVHVSRNSNRIRLPYSVQKVKDAPAYDADEAMSEEREREIYRYYGVAGGTRDTSSTQPRQAAKQGERQETAAVDLVEEQLKVGKREVEAGGVRLRKIVRTETVNQPVELKREEVVVERVPGSRNAPASGQHFEGEDIFIPLRREEAIVQKEATVREQVRVRKTAQTEQQNVSEQVRREDVEVEGTGEASGRIHGAENKPADRMRERQELPRSKRQ